jgi:uncharacterized membrane protein
LTRVSSPSTRHIAIDLARVLAILLMIQGHTLDVLLAPELRQGFFFDKWLFFRGLTAPTFFMLSGVSFFLATSRKWESYGTLSPLFYRRSRKFGFFFLLGYLMHFPVRSFHDFRWLDANGWESFYQVDVLQCIGLTLASLQVLALFAKTPERFAKLAGGAAGLVVLLTPLMWLNNPAFIPHPIAAYLNGLRGSLFPLFPWAGYVLFGVAVGYFCKTWESTHGAFPFLQLGAGGMGLALVGTSLQRVPLTVYGNADYWHTSPNLFLVRIGCVCALLSGFAFLAKRISLPEPAIRSLAQESLVIYFIHVAILYGSLWNTGLKQTIGATLPLAPTLIWIGIMLLSMTALGWSWNWAKKNATASTRMFRYAVVLIAAYSLI